MGKERVNPGSSFGMRRGNLDGEAAPQQGPQAIGRLSQV
jgi:hypothetical protein